jgi:glycosyltransferase involved in cell wall biosynthesis
MLTGQLPTVDSPGSMAFVARQIESLQTQPVDTYTLQVTGIHRFKYLAAIPRMWKWLDAVDLVHAHYGYCGWVARCQLHKPIVVSFMGDDLLGTPGMSGKLTPISLAMVLMNRWLARIADAVIVKSAQMARVVLPVNAWVVPNGINFDLFRPFDKIQARRVLGWDEHRRYILFPGNPAIPRKGFSFAQSAVQITSTLLNTPVELVPLWNVVPERVPYYMNACDAMGMTSFSEGSPNVVKEALACNLPIVSVPVGDVPQLLNGLDGCAVCERDINLLASHLTQILKVMKPIDGRNVLMRLGLDQASVAGKLTQIYRQVLARDRHYPDRTNSGFGRGAN